MKTKKQIAADRTKRRAHIRRGIRIALYEVNQALAAKGVKIATPPWFVPYTVAVAEAGRRDATPEDIADAIRWTEIRRYFLLVEAVECEAWRRMVGGW
jgi:hypothetical protein